MEQSPKISLSFINYPNLSVCKVINLPQFTKSDYSILLKLFFSSYFVDLLNKIIIFNIISTSFEALILILNSLHAG